VVFGVNEVEEGTGGEFLDGVAQNALPGGIEALVDPVKTGDTEHVEGEGEKAVEGFFGTGADEELTDLVAEGGEGIEKVGVRLAALEAEELENGEDFSTRYDGEGDARTQIGLSGEGAAGEVVGDGDFGNPLGLAAAPDATWEPGAEGESATTGDVFELGLAEGGRVPGGRTAEKIPTGFDFPEGSHLPVEGIADGLQQAGGGVGERGGSNESAGGGVADVEALLSALVFRQAALEVHDLVLDNAELIRGPHGHHELLICEIRIADLRTAPRLSAG
jgi:hypothetical protein